MEDAEKVKALVKEAKDEAVKAKEAAEQHGYRVRVAETEDALKAKVLAICRTYCDLTWDEALNQAGVEASSVLKKAESVYYPPTIRPQSSADSKADLESSKAGEIQRSPPKDTSVADASLERVQQAKGTTEAEEGNKEVAHGSNLPPTAPKDPKDKEAS